MLRNLNREVNVEVSTGAKNHFSKDLLRSDL